MAFKTLTQSRKVAKQENVQQIQKVKVKRVVDNSLGNVVFLEHFIRMKLY